MLENRTYDSESYSSSFLPNKSIYNNDDRIFQRNGYAYDTVEAIESANYNKGSFNALVILKSGKKAYLMLTIRSEEIIRLNLSMNEIELSEKSVMFGDIPSISENAEFAETDEAYIIQLCNNSINIMKNPFTIKVVNSEGKKVMELADDKIAGDYPTAPLGFRAGKEGLEPFFSWHIANDESFFGLGEKWNKVEKSSTRSTIWSVDTCGSNTTDMCYKSLPLLFSTNGYGIMNHSAYRSFWEVGTFSYIAGSFLTEERDLDVFIFLAPTLKELIGVYTGLTGRPSLPPPLGYGALDESLFLWKT